MPSSEFDRGQHAGLVPVRADSDVMVLIPGTTSGFADTFTNFKHTHVVEVVVVISFSVVGQSSSTTAIEFRPTGRRVFACVILGGVSGYHVGHDRGGGRVIGGAKVEGLPPYLSLPVAGVRDIIFQVDGCLTDDWSEGVVAD